MLNRNYAKHGFGGGTFRALSPIEPDVLNLKLLLALLCLSNAFFYGTVFFSMRYGMPEASKSFIFFKAGDRWMDFINPMNYARELNPYAHPNSNSPPLMMFSAYLFSLVGNLGTTDDAVYLLIMGILFLFFFCILFTLQKDSFAPLYSISLSLLILGSYPFVYCFDRGNFVILAGAFIAAFLWAYEKDNLHLAAVFLGISAALKLYPAVLGIVFLTNKKFRQAIVCALTGIVATIVPLLIYEGGFTGNLSTFWRLSTRYSNIGNGVLAWIINSRNSFYQLILIPKMAGNDPLEDITQVPSFVFQFKVALTVVFVFVILSCFIMKRKHDQILLLTVMMIGYPIESGTYNLILFAVPFVYWAVKENQCIPMMVLGVLVMTCLNGINVIHTPLTAISLQAVLSPLLLLSIAVFLYYYRRKEILESFRHCRAFLKLPHKA